MKFIKGILTITLVSFAGQQAEAKEVLLAKVSGQTQCEEPSMPPPISEAIESLEKLNAFVMEAKFASLENRRFCNSCSCFSNLYHVAKVSADEYDLNVAIRNGWELVNAEDVKAPALPKFKKKDNHYKLLPVVETK